MPKMDGLEATKAIRSDPILKDIPGFQLLDQASTRGQKEGRSYFKEWY